MPIAIDRTKAMESKGQSKRNRSNMKSDFVLPCYTRSLILPADLSNLLLNPMTAFFILVIVFFSSRIFI